MKHIQFILAFSLSLLLLFTALISCTTTDYVEDTTDSELHSTVATTTMDSTSLLTTSVATSISDETESDPTDDPPSITIRPSQEVKVISMNVDANESTANKRAKLMFPLLLSYDPDSIGMQECRGGWDNILKNNLEKKGYTRVGLDAGGNENATFGYFATYIFYKTEKYDLVDWGMIWMSQTPEIPSIYGSTVDTNRTCTWALLEDKTTGFRYVHMNCHLDWMDMSVNKIQVQMIREQIERFEAMGYPVFAGGDYNCDEGTDSYYAMLDSDTIADSKYAAEIFNDIATYPSYGEYDVYDKSERPIDYFFVTKNFMTVKEYKVIDEKPEGEYISDHFPVFVHAIVTELPVKSEAELTPVFESDDVVTAEITGKTRISVSFPQAKDSTGTLAYEYLVELCNGDEIMKSAVVSSGVLRLRTSDHVTYNLNGINETASFTIKITPIGINGHTGTSISTTIDFTYENSANQMSAADLIDLQIVDGELKDISPNDYSIKKKGTPTIGNANERLALIFKKNGNYAINGFRENYKTMENGFTMEVYFTTGNDLANFQSLVSNMHAGGFGMDVKENNITFSVRIGSSYIGAKAPIETNTTYHVVGVYDTSEVRIYLNGVLIANTPANGSIVHPTENGASYLCIGADSDATGAGEYPIDAAIYFVRMYSDTADDGQALYLFQEAVK